MFTGNTFRRVSTLALLTVCVVVTNAGCQQDTLCGVKLPVQLGKIRDDVEKHYAVKIACEDVPGADADALTGAAVPTVQIGKLTEQDMRTMLVEHELMHLKLWTEGRPVAVVVPYGVSPDDQTVAHIQLAATALYSVISHRIINKRLRQMKIDESLYVTRTAEHYLLSLDTMFSEAKSRGVKYLRPRLDVYASILVDVHYRVPALERSFTEAYERHHLYKAVELAKALIALIDKEDPRTQDSSTKTTEDCVAFIYTSHDGYGDVYRVPVD